MPAVQNWMGFSSNALNDLSWIDFFKSTRKIALRWLKIFPSLIPVSFSICSRSFDVQKRCLPRSRWACLMLFDTAPKSLGTLTKQN